MLQVANKLSAIESRTHFSAWAVTSAPLILGFDLANETLMDLAYPIISNMEVISVNQQVRDEDEGWGQAEADMDLTHVSTSHTVGWPPWSPGRK